MAPRLGYIPGYLAEGPMPMSNTFGASLKDWRMQRRMSQLHLGIGANVSARHISFLETGRARPSRAMVLQLCEELSVPRLSRNQMLVAAGLAPVYSRRDLSAAEMAPVRSAVDWMLERQDPFPAIAMDRHWVIQKLNRSATMLLAGMGIGAGDSLISALADNENLRAAIDNLEEVEHHTVVRLKTEIAHLGGDPVLEAVLDRLLTRGSGKGFISDGVLPAFTPTSYRTGGQVFSFFSTFTQFGTAEDIALAELKIEMMFPADEETHAALMALAG